MIATSSLFPTLISVIFMNLDRSQWIRWVCMGNLLGQSNILAISLVIFFFIFFFFNIGGQLTPGQRLLRWPVNLLSTLRLLQILLYVQKDHKDYCERRTQDGYTDFHTAPELITFHLEAQLHGHVACLQSRSIFSLKNIKSQGNHGGPLHFREFHSTGEPTVWRDPGGYWTCLRLQVNSPCQWLWYRQAASL